MMTFNKMKQLLYLSICFLSKFLIVNYLLDVYLNTPKPIKTTSTSINLILKILDMSTFT